MSELFTIIQSRKSVVSFNPEIDIDQSFIDKMFKAASFAPSANNVQPWRYMYGKKGEVTYEKIYNSLTEGNKRWAKDAPLLIASIAQVEYERNGTIVKNKYAWHDTGMANIQLMLEATAQGLVTHPMGGFDAELLKNALQLSQEYEPIIVIALGYAGNNELLPDDLKERQQKPKMRKEVEEIILKLN
ncbi:MAG TPA: nitroreductase family protein [Bacteroidales bacterium]|nr:nitroreductase family protein [Bacteroidales bacterium]